MAQKVADLMSRRPVAVDKSTSLAGAARVMRDEDIGDVIVMDGDRICGLVTDRDIVVRGIAESADADNTPVDSICSHDLVSVSPDSEVKQAMELMEQKAIRRLPVVKGGKPVGMLSLGDVAIERDRDSTLASISAAEPNT